MGFLDLWSGQKPWWNWYLIPVVKSTAVEQVVACALVTQRARVRSPAGTSFLGEVFSGFFSPVRQMSGSFRPPRSSNIIWPSLSCILIHYGRQWPEMLTRPKNLKCTYISGEFHEIRRAQLDKSTVLTSTFVPWDLFRCFMVCSDVKERVECGKQRDATAPIQSLIKLQPWFLSLRWKTWLR